MGRPRFTVTPELLKEVERLATRGLSRDQIALALGISPRTLYFRKRDNKEFAEALAAGQAKGIAVVANALYENAIGRRGGDGTFLTPPDTRAQIAFLARRDPENWSERRQFEVSGAGGGPVRVLHSAERAEEILSNLLPEYADDVEALDDPVNAGDSPGPEDEDH